MKPKKESTHHVSRKKFLGVFGSVIAGGSIVGVSGALLRKNSSAQKNTIQQQGLMVQQPKETAYPYKLVSSFSVPDKIDCFEICDDKLIAATPNNIYVYDRSGLLLNNFSADSDIRDIAVENNRIYVLYPTRIAAYSMEGEWIDEWEACSPKSDYCQFAVTPDFVFVTDAANKNICKYTADGNFVSFIQSPHGFVIPSYTFGIVHIDGSIYCSNPGRHQVERYSLNGDHIATFGKPGAVAGRFCGCCNPVHLSFTSNGDVITSEKGNPRISCYGPDGQFRSVLLDSKSLGGGNTAYDIKVKGDEIYTAGKNLISTFRYDKVLAAATSCSSCKANCPLREGTLI